MCSTWEGVGVLTGAHMLVLNLGGCCGPVRSTYVCVQLGRVLGSCKEQE